MLPRLWAEDVRVCIKATELIKKTSWYMLEKS